MMTALTAIALSAVFEQGSVTQAMMFSLVIQVGMGFFNMFNGYRTGVKVFQESVVGNQIVRMGIVFKYLRKKKINTSVDKEKKKSKILTLLTQNLYFTRNYVIIYIERGKVLFHQSSN